MPVYEYEVKKKNPKQPKKLPSGKYKWFYYAGKYIDVHGESQSYIKRGFQSSKEAKTAEQEFLLSGKNTSNSRMTLDELFAEYMEYSKLHKEITTCEKDQNIYKNHIQEQFGSKQYLKITARQLIAKYNDLFEQGYKHGTVMNVHKTFNKIYHYADKMYMCEYNPASRAGAPKKKELDDEMKIRPVEDFIKLYNVLKDVEYKAIFMILYFCGLRRGELIGLKWSDYTPGKLRIRKSVAYKKGGQYEKNTKTVGSERMVSINSEICNLLDELYIVKSKEDGFGDEAFIFGSADKSLPFETLRRNHIEFERKAKLPHVRLHDYRHSHVSNLIASKMPVTAVAARIGDTVKTVLETYTHLLQESEQKVDDYLESSSKELMKSISKVYQNKN